MPSNSQSWLIFLASHSSPFSHSVFLFDLRVARLLILGAWFFIPFLPMDGVRFLFFLAHIGPLDFGSLKKATKSRRLMTMDRGTKRCEWR